MCSIKVMSDYECFPLWHYNSEMIGDIDPNSLPITCALADALMAWATDFDQTLNRNNPAISGFESKSAEIAFVVRGYELSKRLKDELKNYDVVYYDIDQLRIRVI